MKTGNHTLKQSLLLAAFASVLIISPPALRANGLMISEFMAANNASLRDEDGDFSDWIEIYNPEREPVSIGGWYLSGDVQDLTPWRLPDVVIGGQSFLLVFASGKDRAVAGGELHTNFKLDR
ncbi:MAG: lamin tail domain-containing protein, partial [Sedimentisphaerales bacterium]|nr:lamin tail domain-containing protein [Sedimentisphaerales bacterium]